MTRYATEEERHEARVANVIAWLDVIEETARELELEVLSRSSETASEAGTDPDPRLRPCEHRREWYRGRLCLACDNTGLRPATAQERNEGLAHDPYLLDPPKNVIQVVRDESVAARRARDAERIDAMIASLQRDSRMRAGAEVQEGALRAVRLMDRTRRTLGPTGRRIVAVLATFSPPLRRAVLRRDERALAVLAEVLPGRIRSPI